MSSILKKIFAPAEKNESDSVKKVNHVVVEIEITEHEYMGLTAAMRWWEVNPSCLMGMTLLALSV